jgi:hypothetical protein
MALKSALQVTQFGRGRTLEVVTESRDLDGERRVRLVVREVDCESGAVPTVA